MYLLNFFQGQVQNEPQAKQKCSSLIIQCMIQGDFKFVNFLQH